MAIIDREFLRDTALVDRYLMPDSLAGRTRLPLHKVANVSDIASSFLGTVGGALSDWVQHELAAFKDDWVSALEELTFEGLIGYFGGWFVTLLDVIVEIGFGVKPIEIFKKINKQIVDDLRKNETINNATIDTAVEQNVGGGAKADDAAIREAWERVGVAATMVKRAGFQTWLVEGGAAVMRRLIGKDIAKSWVGTFFKWLFKIIVGAASIFVKRQVVRNAPEILSGQKPGSGSTSEQGAESSTPSAPEIPSWLKPSDFGTSSEGDGGLWQENVPLASIQDTLVDWAIQVYPQLQSQRGALESSSALANVVNTIRHNNKENYYPSITWIPHHYGDHVVNSRKKLVDLFVGEVASKMPEPKANGSTQ